MRSLYSQNDVPPLPTSPTVGRKAACKVICVCLAIGVLFSTTRFVTSAPPARAAEAATALGAASAETDPDDPALAAHFSGRVTGPDGRLIRGARVFVKPVTDTLDGKVNYETDAAAPTLRATTGDDGRFAFDAPDLTLPDLDGLPTRRVCVLSVEADGYGIEWVTVRGRTRSNEIRYPTPGTDLEIELFPGDVPIHGRLLGPDGLPLADARVRLTRVMIPEDRDLDAHFKEQAKKSIYSGFLHSDTDYERDLWRPDGLPVPAETRTDADGRFTLTGLGRDRLVNLAVSGRGIVDTTLSVMTRDAPDVIYKRRDAPADYPQSVTHGANFTRQLEPGLTITGVVRDRATKQPLPGMWVGLNAEPLNGLSAGEYSRTTDANGRFTIPGLDPKILTYEKPPEVMAVSAPGLPYLTAMAVVKGDDAKVEIECARGIPFRMKLVDEQGRPVEAETVTYCAVQPNPNVPTMRYVYDGRPISRAAHRGGGVYEGFVLPGPGVVLVKTRPGSAYAPAAVDPKAFFAPGRTDWTSQEQITAYGTKDTISTSQGLPRQDDYSAIVLVNPPQDSEPLELSATVVKDIPRRVTLVDPAGKPVVGVQTQGMGRPNTYEPLLRTSSFSLTRLHPDRTRQIMFRHDERKLIAFLEARGGSDEPYTVTMQPWATITGRLVDSEGNPLLVWSPTSDYKGPPKLWSVFKEAEGYDHRLYVDADNQGRFRMEQLVPGKRYETTAYCSFQEPDNQSQLDGLVLRPGEVRDLGDVRTTLSYEPDYRRPWEEDEKATANIPDEAWGEPADGLRVAIVLRAPNPTKYPSILYDIIAENVGASEIRFGAGNHYEYGYQKARIVDVAGKAAARQPGPRPHWVDTVGVKRLRLKAGERAVISTCSERLVQVDAEGKPTAPPSTDVHYHHYFNVTPGRYTISAAVEFGWGLSCWDPKVGPLPVEYAAKGEWTGKLKTGTAETLLLQDANL